MYCMENKKDTFFSHLKRYFHEILTLFLFLNVNGYFHDPD